MFTKLVVFLYPGLDIVNDAFPMLSHCVCKSRNGAIAASSARSHQKAKNPSASEGFFISQKSSNSSLSRYAFPSNGYHSIRFWRWVCCWEVSCLLDLRNVYL